MCVVDMNEEEEGYYKDGVYDSLDQVVEVKVNDEFEEEDII